MADSMLNDAAAMRDAVFFEGPDVRSKFSRFWMLLILASIIAASGVISDSEATVIGAMIVAPLRIPILGTTLAVVLADRRNLLRSAGMVVGGAATAIGVGYVMGMLTFSDATVLASSQMATWSDVGLIDLVAALAVGVVGSIALVRRDISDTLPGVAIAISLVPPLTVVGLALRVGSDQQALGAFLLFATNVSAILAVGIVTMGLYRVQRYGAARRWGNDRPVNRTEAYVVIGVSLVLIFAILAQRSVSVTHRTQRAADVGQIVSDWGDGNGWEVVDVSTVDGVVVVRVEGQPPVPDTDDLEDRFRDEDVEHDQVRVDFLPRESVTFSANQD